MSFFEKKYWYQRPISNIVLLLMPILPFILGAKLQWSVYVILIFVIIFERKLISKSKYSLWVVFLILPVIWSFLLTLNGDYYYIIQSLFYLLTPYLMVCLGIQLGGLMSKKEDIYKYIIYSGSIGSLCFILYGVIFAGNALFTDIYKLRSMMLWGSATNVLSIVILLFSEKYQIKIIKKKRNKNLLLFINILALILTASRTYYIVFLVFVLLFLFDYKKSIFLTLGVLLLLALSFVLSIESDNLMITKIQNSFSEISNTKQFAGYDDVNAYYRAYETQQALNTYKSGTELELIMGKGLQKMVDLDIYVDLAGTYRRFIPVLHNGYAYLLLRTGFLGVVFYGLFFIKIFFVRNYSEGGKFLYLLHLGNIFCLLISNYVISTFFSTELLFAWVMIGINFIWATKNK